MINLNKKYYWIAGLIGAVSLTGGYMYLQVKKILDYTLGFVGVSNVKATTQDISMTFKYEYQNKANIDITIVEQEYLIYINEVYIATLKNVVPNVLYGGKKSEINVDLKLNYKEVANILKVNYLSLVALPQNVKIKTVMKWKVKYGLLKIPITYPYEVTLKEVLSWYIPKK